LGYIETILEPGERITYRAYLHWIIYVRPGWVMLIGVLLILYAANTVTGDQDTAKAFAVVGFILSLLGTLGILIAAISRWTTEIAVTNQRVILKRGLIRRDTIEINMPKVESVDVRQSILGRLLNYGTVIVRGTGGSTNPLTTVAEPLPLRRAVTLAAKASS
jgi:uncharacterized membrane protein YdbT with pleckstrin-like domain